MAEVFLARYGGLEGFEKHLVIKRILPRFSHDRALLRLFFEEARTHVSLSHGNLVSVFDFGRVGNEYFIAMEYVAGVDLAKLIGPLGRGNALPPGWVAYLGIEICRALGYVHRRGLVHRDVSPRNVLLSRDGEVKLSDFGLVLTQQSDHAALGTLAFAAPEQARGERADGRSDLYALGVVLAEASTGTVARPSNDEASAIAVARAGAPLAIEGPFAAVIARATQTDPTERFDTADAMLAALEQAAAAVGYRREEVAREIGRRVTELAPDVVLSPNDEAPAARHELDVTAPEGPRGRPPVETYFRDRKSASFVDEVLDDAPPPRRSGRLIVFAALGATAIGAVGAIALTRSRAQAPLERHAGPTPREDLASALPIASRDLAASADLVPPVDLAPPAPPRATPPRAAPLRTGTLAIQCTPWCVPLIDGVRRGDDRRHHTIVVGAGRHRVSAERLTDRLDRTVEVEAGRTVNLAFDFRD